MPKYAICQNTNCNKEFKVGPGCKGIFCSRPCKVTIERGSKSPGSRGKIKHIDSYNNNPKLCSGCQKPIDYDNRKNKYCSMNCATTYRSPPNLRHGRGTKQALEARKKFNKLSQYSYTKIYFKTCISCDKIFVSKGRKTCSYECQIDAVVGERKYINGRRLNIYYFNKHENKNVLLESSWEETIAKRLDDLGIAWTRPKYIKWIDNLNKSRLYYPDFYLPSVNVYLDPKNPHGMITGKLKMEAVEKLINIKYGSIEFILDYINNLEPYENEK